ncbi:MAG: InlB B-repeat-containing protein, partial [Nitrososphaeria archaeon]
QNVFVYYTNFTNFKGWVAGGKVSYSADDGLVASFNGPGYLVTNSSYGPGTGFVAGVSSIGDVDDVGYFDINQTANGGTAWAGAFIRLACGYTYPDQWNASGEANGCGSAYGYFVNAEGIPGIYMVEILNRTSSVQSLNGMFSKDIRTDYPEYPARVGFDGVYSSLSVKWAFVFSMPPDGVMPEFNVSQDVYPAGSSQNVHAPNGILYYVPIEINNDQAEPTQDPYQQLVLINSSEYSRYEAYNLQNVEFFYANGTVIPSWLENSPYLQQNAHTFPRSVAYQPYVAVNSSKTFTEYIGTGAHSVSVGVFNGTVKVDILQGDNVLDSREVRGCPFDYVVSVPSPSYFYVNFKSTGQPLQITVTRVNGSPLVAYNVYSGFISNFTASLITLPPQFALDISPYPATATPVNTGMSFILKAPKYSEPTPLAIWIGEGYWNPTGAFWWAQIGFNNWAGGNMNVSYAGWGIFSNIFPSVGGTDTNYPLIPGKNYNFTMALVSGTTWEFLVNGTLIREGNLTGLFNVTTSIANSGADLGLETLTAWGGNVNITNLITIPVAMSFRVKNGWTEQNNLSLDVVGENWWNKEATASPGISIWGVEGSLQNSSIPEGEVLFNDSLSRLFIFPPLDTGPVYGSYTFSAQDTPEYYASVKVENDGTIYVVPDNGTVLFTIASYSGGTENYREVENAELTGLRCYVVTHPELLANPFADKKAAIFVAKLNNLSNGAPFYPGKVQEMLVQNSPFCNECAVTFTESGLRPGTQWSVMLNGITKYSTGNITFTVPSGLYNFSVGSVEGYMTSPFYGSVYVEYPNVTQHITFVPVTFNYTFHAFTQNYPAVNVTAASTGLQISAISYGDGVYLIGGEETANSPLLLEYNISSGEVKDLSSSVPATFRFITSISYAAGAFYIGGVPSGNQWAFAELNLSTGQIRSLSSAFPTASIPPSIYAVSSFGNVVYLGGYYRYVGQGSFLYSYNIKNGSAENLSSLLPPQSIMTLTLSSNGKNELFIAGILGNYSSFSELYNTTTGSVYYIDLPPDVESLGASAFINGSFFVGGSSLTGAELLEINDRGSITGNYSSYLENYIQVVSLASFNRSVLVGGWGPNGAFVLLLNPEEKQDMSEITMTGGWAVQGSELLASSSDGNTLMVGGAVTTQFGNYSGALLGLVYRNGSFADMSSRVPKTYQSCVYYQPPQQNFYVGAVPNVVSPNGSITFYGQFLATNASYRLIFGSNIIPVRTNRYGFFSCTVELDNLEPGDYLITLSNGSKNYYNYFAVLYYYPYMIYGARIPKASEIGYSILKDGAVVRDGQYIEFYRQTEGEIPVTSINYLVQWNQIMFQNLTPAGWTVAPLGQLGYASQYSINPMVYQYSFWNDYGISEVTASGRFIPLARSNSYLYIEGNTMILWIPYSLINETEFPWAFATDYVQNSPVYNPNYRIEAGQSFLSYFCSNETPSSFIAYSVKFVESGLPVGTEWSVTLDGMTKTSNTDAITFQVPNGKYNYGAESSVSGGSGIRYLALNASGAVTVNGSNLSVAVPYQTQYYLTMVVIPSNAGNILPGSGWHNAGASVNISATANNGYRFYKWVGTGSGSYSGTENPATVTVNGPVTEVASFEELYQVAFTESGLPIGAQWTVALNGTTKSSNASAITFDVPAGTYAFSVGPVSGYSVLPSSGTLTVNSNISQKITFSQLKAVTFTETGLPAGASWSVTLNGVTKTSTNSTITFMIPPGNYTYTISYPSGYKASQSTGTVSVSASSVQAPVAVTYTAVTTAAPQQNQSALIITATVTVIAIIAVVALVLRRRK